MRANRQQEQGNAIVLAIMGLGLVLFILVSIFIVIFTALPAEISTLGSSINKNSVAPVQNNDSIDKVTETNSNIKPNPIGPEQDLNLVELVCVNLPGISYPKTPALDRRVARRYLRVKQELDDSGVAALNFTWAYRTTCQQTNINSGGNLKAKAGQSPHEAGRALDVSGMTRRSDTGAIIHAFLDNGFVWLGKKDPPHFEVKGYVVGEPDHLRWIRKAHEFFNNADGKTLPCKGTDCGGV